MTCLNNQLCWVLHHFTLAERAKTTYIEFHTNSNTHKVLVKKKEHACLDAWLPGTRRAMSQTVSLGNSRGNAVLPQIVNSYLIRKHNADYMLTHAYI